MTTNEHYAHWKGEDSPEALNGLMAAVQRQALRQAKIKMPEHAEDIAQEATLKVWQHIADYEPARSSFSTWVYEITKNTIRDHHKKQSKQPSEPVEASEETPVQQQPFTDYTRLHDAFSSDPQLLLLLMDGHSMADCQHLLDLTRKALRYRIEKIRNAAQQGPSL